MKKMKVAIITSGNPRNMKGIMNFVQEKLNRLQKIDNIEFDFFMIRHRDTFLFSLIRGTPRPKKERFVYIEGIKYHNIWVKHSLFDYIASYRLKRRAFAGKKGIEKYYDKFAVYDVVSSHSLDAHYLAYLIKRNTGIPYISTWHGSDINIVPFRNKKTFQLTGTVMQNAFMNFFVSKKLLLTSEKISVHGNKECLYTGPSDIFYKKSEENRRTLLEQYNIRTKHVIGFIGNLIPVKNVLVLPLIFEEVQNKCEDISFIIVGDGNLGSQLKDKCKEHAIKNVHFLGKQEPSRIPDIMNCLDILVLPSVNEGLPLVTLEALSCGVHVVGSDVGGIPESIGTQNTFRLDNFFVENISERMIEILQEDEKPKPLSDEFSWDKAIEKEVNVYRSIVKERQSDFKT